MHAALHGCPGRLTRSWKSFGSCSYRRMWALKLRICCPFFLAALYGFIIGFISCPSLQPLSFFDMMMLGIFQIKKDFFRDIPRDFRIRVFSLYLDCVSSCIMFSAHQYWTRAFLILELNSVLCIIFFFWYDPSPSKYVNTGNSTTHVKPQCIMVYIDVYEFRGDDNHIL